MKYLIATLVFITVATNLKGQTVSTTTSGTIDVATAMSVTITNLIGVVSFDDANDYTNGQTMLNAASIAVKSNVTWLMTIAAQSANFQSLSSGGSTNMPASIVKMRRNGTTSYLTLATGAQTLKTGSPGGATASGNTFNTDVSITPGFGYNAGSYNVGVLFTLTQQ